MSIFSNLFGGKKTPSSIQQSNNSMREFLIKRADGKWFDLNRSSFEEVLKPASMVSHNIQGWGDHRIEVNGCEISFSFEDPGIQVCIEGNGLTEEEAIRVADEIAHNITAATGQQSNVIPL